MTVPAPRRRRSPAFLIAGYALLLAAWVFGNAPFASPDETAHYLRAVGIAQGEVIADGGRYARSASLSEQQLDWINRFTGTVTVPAGLAPVTGTPCFVTDETNSAACHPLAGAPVERRELTYVATYLPAPYLLPALATAPADEPKTALWLARLVAALLFLSFVAAAVLLLWARDDGLSLVGLIVALTPMAVFLGASLNPNALEIATATAFTAALLRLTRAEPAPRAAWVALGVAGALLALSRPTGPLWLVTAAALVLVARGAGPAWNMARSATRPSLAAGGGILAAVAATAAWELGVGGDVPAATGSSLATRLEYGLYQIPEILPEQIGIFGYRTVEMPYGAYASWWALVLGVGALALLVGRRREQAALLVAAALVVLVPVSLYALVFAESGFSLQGRYFLGLAVVVPLLAGETVHRNRHRLGATNLGGLPTVVAAVAGVVHFAGWYWNARQYAIGANGPIWFAPVAVWSPPGSWWPWTLTAVAGAALLAGAGAAARRQALRP